MLDIGYQAHTTHCAFALRPINLSGVGKILTITGWDFSRF